MAHEEDRLIYGSPPRRYFAAFGYPVMHSAMACLNQSLKWMRAKAPTNPNSFGGRLEELFQNYFWWSSGMTIPWVYMFHAQTFIAWHT